MKFAWLRRTESEAPRRLAVDDGGVLYLLPEIDGRYQLLEGRRLRVDLSHEQAVRAVAFWPMSGGFHLAYAFQLEAPGPGTAEVPSEFIEHSRAAHAGRVCGHCGVDFSSRGGT